MRKLLGASLALELLRRHQRHHHRQMVDGGDDALALLIERHAAPVDSTDVAGRQESPARVRSEEHTSELQSLRHLVCRLLLEEKNSMRIKSYVYACFASS